MKYNVLLSTLLCHFVIYTSYESSNAITLQSYESHINEYIEGTPSVVSGIPKDWIDATLSLLSKESTIIEIGSAFGRDACYMETHGFTVERTDATHNFVTLLQQQEYNAHNFNVLTDDFTKTYDLIFANAVFLHFTHSELESVIKKIHQALSPKGILAFSVKHGEGEAWSTEKLGSERYYCYWQLDSLKEFLSPYFEITTSFMDERFLYIIAIKM